MQRDILHKKLDAYTSTDISQKFIYLPYKYVIFVEELIFFYKFHLILKNKRLHHFGMVRPFIFN